LAQVAGLDYGQDYEREAENLSGASFAELEATVRIAAPDPQPGMPGLDVLSKGL
jgi:hypothetical protein